MDKQNPPDGNPQFGTAEYVEELGDGRCRTCEQAIAGSFYRVNGATTCTACAEKAVGQLPKDTNKAFSRALVFGIGGSFLGLMLYSVVGIVTGLAIGFVSLAVGYIVGKAMMMGSWGIGGRRYQVAAAVLTYAAVSLSAIPVGISIMIKQKGGLADSAAKPQVVQPQASDALQNSSSTDVSRGNPSEQDQAGIGIAIASLVVIGLASPFLDLSSPMHGILGLIILLVGIQIAWKTTAGRSIDVQGPFNA